MDNKIDISERIKTLETLWIKEKPNCACKFLTRHAGEYELWSFEWLEYDDIYYLAWLDKDGAEWDDVSECNFEEYLILELLPNNNI